MIMNKKKHSISPTQRTLKRLRELGYVAGITEHWNPFAHIRQDLFGFADIVAMNPNLRGVTYIQCTTDTNRSERVKKLMANKYVRIALQSGNKVEIWTWGKKKKAKYKAWQVTAVNFILMPDGEIKTY